MLCIKRKLQNCMRMIFFCTGIMVGVGHVACTGDKREIENCSETSRAGIILDQFGIDHVNMRMKVKPSSYIDYVWGSGGNMHSLS